MTGTSLVANPNPVLNLRIGVLRFKFEAILVFRPDMRKVRPKIAFIERESCPRVGA